ncbi:two pore domain potassium channel family protein [Candidatus Poribacteria bacterium]|nr:two pore domain potassium channel family protein [Candidatus Poribacteria bacterium]
MKSIQFRLRVFLVMLLAVVIIGTLGFTVIEKLSPADAFYFTIITIATVGYGDISPLTPIGKFLAITLTISGVGTFLGVIANVTEMMLNRREEDVRLQRLHMIIGVFFSEVGTQLLALFSDFTSNLDRIHEDVIVTPDWNEKDFLRASEHLKNANYGIDIQKGKLGELHRFLVEKRNILVGLLLNPILLEKESFTCLLQAVFHLNEELDYRKEVMQLPDADNAHLIGDIKRIYDLLIDQWLDYMKYLKNNFPYLFSLALRTNPFDEKASPIVK